MSSSSLARGPSRRKAIPRKGSKSSRSAAHGRGIAGERAIPGVPGRRTEREVFEQVAGYLSDDPLFRHVNDVGFAAAYGPRLALPRAGRSG